MADDVQEIASNSSGDHRGMTKFTSIHPLHHNQPSTNTSLHSDLVSRLNIHLSGHQFGAVSENSPDVIKSPAISPNSLASIRSMLHAIIIRHTHTGYTSKPPLNLLNSSHSSPHRLLGRLRRLLIRCPRPQLLLRAHNARLWRRKHRRSILGRRNAALDRTLRKRRLLLQLHRLGDMACCVQLVDARRRLGKDVRKGADAPGRADRQPADEEIRLSAVHGELVFRERGREAGDFRDGAARQLDADDVGHAVRASSGRGTHDRRDGLRVEVDAVAHAGEVVQHDGEWALRCDVREEPLHHGHGRRLAEVGGRENEHVVGAGVSGVSGQLQDLFCGVGADAGHEGVVGADGFAGRRDEGFAFFAREEEGFGIGTEDDEPGEAGLGEVGIVLLLGFEVECVDIVVEEGHGGAPDPGSGDVGLRGDTRHDYNCRRLRTDV